MTEFEQRTIDVDVSDLETRGRTIHGFAAVYGVESHDLGGFREVVQRGAFGDVLAQAPDVRCLLNHDPSQVLGRTRSGTLRLADEERGLRFECDLPSSPLGDNVREAVGRGDVDGASFRFSVARDGESWVGDKRTITRVGELMDCSVATFGAYPAASIELRTRSPKEMTPVNSDTGTTPAQPADETATTTTTATAAPSATATTTTHGLTVEQRTARPDGGTVEHRVIEAMRSVPRGETRSLTTADASAGPVDPPELNRFIWDLLRDQAVVLQAGCPVITTDRTSVKWPALISDITAAFFDELDEIDVSDPGFDEFDVTPKAIKALVRGSSEAFEDSDPDLLQIVQQNLVTILSLKLDRALLTGSVTAEPKGFDGMTTVAGTTSLDASGTMNDYDLFIKAIGILAGNHVPGPYVAVGHPWTITYLDLLKRQADNNEQLSRPPSVPPIFTSTQIGDNGDDTSTMLVFAPAQVAVVRRRDVTVEVDRSAEFTTDAVLVRGKLRASSFFPYPQAIVKIENVPAPDPSA
jgi:HK97 family phage prohead protease/HK97 family phage major capsid protein